MDYIKLLNLVQKLCCDVLISRRLPLLCIFGGSRLVHEASTTDFLSLTILLTILPNNISFKNRTEVFRLHPGFRNRRRDPKCVRFFTLVVILMKF